MTQKGFGLAIGLEEEGADSRIAQYEINYRIPKRDMLEQMAVVLRVSPMNFYSDAPGCSEDIMQTFFSLCVIPARQIPLTMPLCGTTITTIGLSMPRWECISNMDWLTSSCGNGCCGKRS